MNTLNKEQLQDLYRTKYVSNFLFEERKQKRRIKRLLKFIDVEKNDVILDVGCGNGLLLDSIFNKIHFYYGVDFSEDFITTAKTRQIKNEISNAKFVCGDINIFCKNFKDYFDKIFAIDFVEHIYNDDFIEIFTSLFNSLKTGGELYIHTPNGNYFLEILKKKGLMKQIPEHIGIRNPEDYKKLLEESGFNDIKFIYLSHYIKILSLFDFLRYMPILGKYFKARLFIICKK